MRIAVIAPPWAPIPPVSYGGIESVVDQLAIGFQAAGHEVLLASTDESTCPVPRLTLGPAAESQIGMATPELVHVTSAYDAIGDCDIVHDHTLAGPLYAERFAGLTVATTAHGPLDGEARPVYAHMADRLAIIAISRAQARSAPEVGIAGVIHHGVDADQFPLGSGDGGYCLFLGRMSPDKGAHRAIAVARRAGLPLVLAAKLRDPAEHEYFEKFVEPELGDGATFVGEASADLKRKLLASARALLFPIRWNEPFGMVMIESLACGTPVLAFRQGSVPEIVEHGVTGYVCNDEVQMASALREVGHLDRSACRAAVRSRFSSQRMVAKHLALFETLIRSRRRASFAPRRRDNHTLVSKLAE